MPNPTIWIVYHVFDVDGGFGDAVSVTEVAKVFTNKDDAASFVRANWNPRIVDVPYQALTDGYFYMKETPIHKGPSDANDEKNALRFTDYGVSNSLAGVVDPDNLQSVDDDEDDE